MDLLDVFPEVIESSVLPYLGWNDLLRLRRVCKWTKEIVTGYIKVHPELAPEIEINETDKDIGAFLKMGIPTTRIFFNTTSGDTFYRNVGTFKDRSKFLERFGPLVKHLRLHQISVYIYSTEETFLRAFTNLQSLEAGKYGVGKWSDQGLSPSFAATVTDQQRLHVQYQRFSEEGLPPLPADAFKNLKIIKIGNNDNMAFLPMLLYYDAWLGKCEMLESYSFPFKSELHVPSFYPAYLHDHPMAATFSHLATSIRVRREKQIPPIENLQLIDFESFRGADDIEKQTKMEWAGSALFLDLCDLCVKYNVKLRNVGCYWFILRDVLPNCSPELGTPVLSLINMHPCVRNVDMPDLEKIEIQNTSYSSTCQNWRQDRPNWSALKTLDITVDSKNGMCWEWFPQREECDLLHVMSTKELFQFFFQDVARTAMTELRFNFIGEADKVAIPKLDEVVSACPNLKKLTIVNWPGTNKALTKLWKGLPGLEEISLEYCKDLGNVAFVGEDQRSPLFLKLTNLKKLTLKGLDRMPKITDTLFSLVIRHMKLTHLILSSDGPMKSVTLSGMNSLLGGKFAESIEKFPFQDWSLAEVSKEEWKKLKMEFRSSSSSMI